MCFPELLQHWLISSSDQVRYFFGFDTISIRYSLLDHRQDTDTLNSFVVGNMQYPRNRVDSL